MTTPKENSPRIENAKSYLLGMNTGDVNIALKAFADDATYYGVQRVDGQLKRKLHGSKAEIKAYIGHWLELASGGITYEVKSAKEWGDCVLVEWADSATGGGKQYDNEGILLFEFNEKDQIKHARAYQHMGPLVAWGFPR